MSSLICNGEVLDYGNIQETATAWIGQQETLKSNFPTAYLIDEEPPYPSNWLYINGGFFDLNEQNTEAEEFTAQQEAQQKAAIDAAQSYRVRERRDALLFESDWTQGKDIPDSISTPWAIYRQQLRDITDQPGFPWDVVWPEKPQIT